METIREKSGDIQEIRDGRGRFLKGVSGNPAGKPKGIKHMTTILTEALIAVAENGGESEDIAIVKALIQKAKSGDVSAIREIWDRTEGKPVQAIVTEDEEGKTMPLHTINVTPIDAGKNA
jgi:hypothetical protein